MTTPPTFTDDLHALADEPCIANEGNGLIPRVTKLERALRAAADEIERLNKWIDATMRAHDAVVDERLVAMTRVAELEAALRWYADEANWESRPERNRTRWGASPVALDRGARARAALGNCEKTTDIDELEAARAVCEAADARCAAVLPDSREFEDARLREALEAWRKVRGEGRE